MQRQTNPPIYTHHLPYQVRREIWNLLDADQSWKTLAGQFMGIDATEMTLIGQAYLRANGSPTEELFRKLDSANVQIAQLCYYLEKMNHCRAVETLKPYMINEQQLQHDRRINKEGAFLASNSSQFNMRNFVETRNSATLYTPTPSFSERPAHAIMDYNYPIEAIEDCQRLDWCEASNNNQQQPAAAQTQAQPPADCHKSLIVQNAQHISGNQEALQQCVPSNQPVKVACTSERKRTSLSDQEVINQLRLIMQIDYNELKQASNDFSSTNILGNGGFASVYRGNWKGTDVAIKRLKFNLMEQALNEMSILNSYRIDNILPIYGISTDGPEACLVYQFMANGSLEDRLSCKGGTSPLTWSQRANIGEGIAKALYYLHTLRVKPLIHGDVKSANVLLDSQLIPKLGDFGLARQMFKGEDAHTQLDTHCTVTSIHGTSVYLPPEYLRLKIFSPAVDVYSYGTVLLEMATGRRAYDGKRLLVDLVESALSKGLNGCSIKDSRLSNESQDELRIWHDLLIKLGLNCANKWKKKRPDMGLVLNKFSEFKTMIQAVRTPTPEPSCVYERLQQPERLAPSNQMIAQINNATLNRVEEYSNKEEGAAKNWVVLMSVEEEAELNKQMKVLNQQDTDSIGLQEQIPTSSATGKQQDSTEGPVEAMIPLLTELGIEAEQEQEQMQQAS